MKKLFILFAISVAIASCGNNKSKVISQTTVIGDGLKFCESVVYLDFLCRHKFWCLVVKNIRNGTITSCYIVFLIVGIVAWFRPVRKYNVH